MKSTVFYILLLLNTEPLAKLFLMQVAEINTNDTSNARELLSQLYKRGETLLIAHVSTPSCLPTLDKKGTTPNKEVLALLAAAPTFTDFTLHTW